MTRLFLHGLGTCALGEEAPFAEGLGEIPDVPIKDYAAASVRRRYARLARLMVVAGSRALADAGVADPSQVAVVAGTALGELRASLELVCQIRATRGAQVSPALVPNSVHNAPAGHLTIALKNHCPSVTVSQGWLSAEAALAAAADVLSMGGATRALVVAGDEVDAAWAGRLREAGAGELAAALEAEAFQEGAAALVVGLEPGEKPLGAVEASVERAGDPKARAASLVARLSAGAGGASKILLRVGAGGESLRAAIGGAIAGRGIGTSQAGALLELARISRDTAVSHALLLGAECDELGWIAFSR
jgi:hypothetical protein